MTAEKELLDMAIVAFDAIEKNTGTRYWNPGVGTCMTHLGLAYWMKKAGGGGHQMTPEQRLAKIAEACLQKQLAVGKGVNMSRVEQIGFLHALTLLAEKSDGFIGGHCEIEKALGIKL